MTVRYSPPQLASGRNSHTLSRLAEELTKAEVPSELRVLQAPDDSQLRLVFIAQGKQPSSTQLPKEWLYSDVSETVLRERLTALATAG